MKTILCYGDSNTWGYAPNQNRRYTSTERWPGILQMLLGEDVCVIEEGLPGRTTVHKDPIEGDHKSGESYLLPCLESHHPDFVILVLGTNDLKHRFGASAEDVAKGAAKLVAVIQGFQHPMMKRPPKVLLVVPPPIKEVGYFADMFKEGEAKSKGLAQAFSEQAALLNCECLDAGEVIQSCPKEGIHWQQTAHQKLAESIYQHFFK